MLIKHPGRQNT